jgi:hypothetical protein
MLRCVHGKLFCQKKLRSDERRVENVWCSHCDEMHGGTVWLALCCFDRFRQAYEDVSILNSGAYCMLCNECMSTLKPLGQLTEGHYHKQFEFYYDK